MAFWNGILPLTLLACGAIPFLIEARCRFRVTGAVFAFVFGFALLMTKMAPEVHIWTKSTQLIVIALSVLTILWLEQKHLEGERSGGLLVLHSLTYLYVVSIRYGFSSIGFWFAAVATTLVTAAAFVRLRGSLLVRLALASWLGIVLFGLFSWQIDNALSNNGLMEILPQESGIDYAKLILQSTSQILYGGSIAFLALSLMSALKGAWSAISEIGTAPLLNTRSIGIGPAQDRRFPIPGAIAVLVFHGLPLLLFRLLHPLCPEAMVLNISLAVSPLLVTGLLNRTGWGGLREVPLQDETGLDRMRRSTLHQARQQRRAS